ncbi:peptidoglycan-binding domain-containing protein [Roseofilum capinflatum]|uniref:Peptidoglycan-binding domain-containing protein n=1 Tax=Roseofilum capinflatum BLCC-M114 TaxID=3022440 RepID=A0ABT7B425_9CYAN|nr:peptidoglycan-binding domain-containing protein [Roseofilum capinflatum]MDJ1173920.1 peptidoglycan-binding domain-containing protein [Roseofilum capinflatum BLCC-M114]
MDSLAYLHLALAYQDPTSPELILGKWLKQFWQQWLSKPISSRFILRLLSVATALTILTLAQAALALLQRGSVGLEVRELQWQLQQLGYYQGPIDGNFDWATDQAVRNLQRQAGLQVDGVVGQDTTWAISQRLGIPPRIPTVPVSSFLPPPPPPNFNTPSYLGSNVYNPSVQSFGTINRQLAPGAQGNDVVELQRLLINNGFNPGPIDGYYGPLTRDAVEQFQLSRGLFANGIADAETIQALYGGGSGNNMAIPRFTPKGYVVVIPTGDNTLVTRVQEVNSGAQLYRNRRGRYIYVGTYGNRDQAESQSAWLRFRGFTNARVVYFR